MPLFQREELLSNDIIVTITIHLEDPPTIDSDFFTAVCDDTVCNGMSISDSGNYTNNACTYVTMNSGATCTYRVKESVVLPLPMHSSQTLPQSRSIPSTSGPPSAPPNGGYTTAATFSRQLDLTKGLYLEVYGHDANEEYKLQFMEVKVMKNS